MDQSELDTLVQTVLKQMGYAAGAAAPAVAAAAPVAQAAAPSVTSEGTLPDLGTDEFKYWIGVQEPNNLQVLKELRQSTQARVCSGRTGPRPRTTTLLRFLADHSRSKDTVLKEISADWVTRAGLFEVQSQITDKDEYLTRPDKGRLLSQAAIDEIQKQCKKNPQVQVVVSDGLSTDAITANLDEILPPLMKGLKNAGIDAGNPFFVRYGRVKIEDQIGELLGAKVVILLIGERPGLGQLPGHREHHRDGAGALVGRDHVGGKVDDDAEGIAQILGDRHRTVLDDDAVQVEPRGPEVLVARQVDRHETQVIVVDVDEGGRLAGSDVTADANFPDQLLDEQVGDQRRDRDTGQAGGPRQVRAAHRCVVEEGREHKGAVVTPRILGEHLVLPETDGEGALSPARRCLAESPLIGLGSSL